MNNQNTTNRYHIRTAALAAAALLAVFSSDANANPVFWTGQGANSRVLTAENWTNNTPPLIANGILGIINTNVTVTAGASAGGNVSGYNVEQQTGLLAAAGNITLSGGTIWTLKGGSISTPTNIFGLNASSLIIDGGTFSSTRRFDGTNASLLELKSGSFSNGDVGLRVPNTSQNLTVRVSGGSLTTPMLSFETSPSSFTVTGGTVNITSATASTLGAGMTFGLGGGSVTFATAPTVSATSAINFLTGSTGSLTVTGFQAANYEAWWNAGSLKVDGGNTGTFSNNFQVTGATIVLVPEPATLGLTALGVGLAGAAFWRRRRG